MPCLILVCLQELLIMVMNRVLQARISDKIRDKIRVVSNVLAFSYDT